MRIDSNPGAQPLSENQTSGSAAAANANVAIGSQASSALGNTLGEDQAQLSGVHVQVQALVEQAQQLPEIRQDKVQALRQAVNDGSYQPSADDVAGALFSNLVDAVAA
jgi:flagellar biosynthesis anti-sigma factor FlgM